MWPSFPYIIIIIIITIPYQKELSLPSFFHFLYEKFFRIMSFYIYTHTYVHTHAHTGQRRILIIETSSLIKIIYCTYIIIIYEKFHSLLRIVIFTPRHKSGWWWWWWWWKSNVYIFLAENFIWRKTCIGNDDDNDDIRQTI